MHIRDSIDKKEFDSELMKRVEEHFETIKRGFKSVRDFTMTASANDISYYLIFLKLMDRMGIDIRDKNDKSLLNIEGVIENLKNDPEAMRRYAKAMQQYSIIEINKQRDWCGS